MLLRVTISEPDKRDFLQKQSHCCKAARILFQLLGYNMNYLWIQINYILISLCSGQPIYIDFKWYQQFKDFKGQGRLRSLTLLLLLPPGVSPLPFTPGPCVGLGQPRTSPELVPDLSRTHLMIPRKGCPFAFNPSNSSIN